MFAFTHNKRVGKSVYEYDQFEEITHHDPKNHKAAFLVPNNIGFIGHYRKIFTIPSFTYQMHDISFDLNYFNCIMLDFENILKD